MDTQLVEIMENYCKVCGDTYPMFGCRCDVTRAPSFQTGVGLSSSSIRYGCFSQ
jgi:hypothetical protein